MSPTNSFSRISISLLDPEQIGHCWSTYRGLVPIHNTKGPTGIYFTKSSHPLYLVHCKLTHQQLKVLLGRKSSAQVFRVPEMCTATSLKWDQASMKNKQHKRSIRVGSRLDLLTIASMHSLLGCHTDI